MLESKLQILMTRVISQMEITKDPAVHGSTLVPILLGSDKTITSVGMGNVEYYPLYMSIGNLHNGARRAHCGGVAVIGFLAIPTCESPLMLLLVASRPTTTTLFTRREEGREDKRLL